MSRASLEDLTAVIVSDFGHVTGGAAQVAILSALGLLERGVRTLFVYAVGPLDERLSGAAPDACRHLPLDDVWSVRNPLKAAMNGIWNASAAAQLARVLAELDRDRTIVHFHQWTKAFSPSVIEGALRRGFRTAVTLHDYFFACPNGAYYNYKTEAPCTLRPLTPACLAADCDSRNYAYKLVRTARQATQRIMLSRHDAMPAAIHVSERARGVLEAFLPPGARHYVLANPVPMERLERSPAETNCNYLFVGRLVPEKGCLAFARAARRAGVPAVFAGAGPCEAEIRKANPDARLLGWLPHQEIVATVRGARALVFPSRWYETSGLVCGEALANGIPVLASSRTAAVELVAPGANGDVFDPDDETALARLLEGLQDSDAVARLSKSAYARYWAAPPTLGAHVGNLLDIYSELLGPPPG
jgi:glycosyltransferase involved in cell wall biosynthesis